MKQLPEFILVATVLFFYGCMDVETSDELARGVNPATDSVNLRLAQSGPDPIRRFTVESSKTIAYQSGAPDIGEALIYELDTFHLSLLFADTMRLYSEAPNSLRRARIYALTEGIIKDDYLYGSSPGDWIDGKGVSLLFIMLFSNAELDEIKIGDFEGAQGPTGSEYNTPYEWNPNSFAVWSFIEYYPSAGSGDYPEAKLGVSAVGYDSTTWSVFTPNIILSVRGSLNPGGTLVLRYDNVVVADFHRNPHYIYFTRGQLGYVGNVVDKRSATSLWSRSKVSDRDKKMREFIQNQLLSALSHQYSFD